MSNSRPFPVGFLWGAATSSHQVEGDNRWNDWWEYEQSGRLPYRSSEACRHYELYEQDFDLARAWGHNAHRFSIEWSRLEPSEGNWNPDEMEHYRAVVRALRKRNLEPVVTLHHFTNPAWFTKRGGWLRSDSAALFGRYTARVVEQLGREVKFWLTINEPTVYVMQGYIAGEWPPRIKDAWPQAILALRNLARAHVAAYRALHDRRSDLMVGFAHSAPLVMPCNRKRRLDCLAALIRDFLLNRLFFMLIGASLKSRARTTRRLDYLGINYYTRTVIKVGSGLRAFLGQACHDDHHSDNGPRSDLGWEVYPTGLRITLEKFSHYGVPLCITENGIATDNEDLRRLYIIQHLQSLAKALGEGVDVIGYLHWSLIDNYEWALGMAPHFGLAAVDPVTQERRPRPCAKDFRRICDENRITLDDQWQ